MKFLKIFAVAAALSALAVAPCRAVTSQVFRLTMSWPGVIAFTNFYTGTLTNGVTGVLTNPISHNVSISQYDIINLARGRNLGTRVPLNEVLALAVPCATNFATVLVWDHTGQSNLVTIGQLDTQFTAPTVLPNTELANIISARDLSTLTITNTGNATNALTSGTLFLDHTSVAYSNGCLLSLSGKLVGLVNTIVSYTYPKNTLNPTNLVSAIPVFIPTGRATVGGPAIGTLITP